MKRYIKIFPMILMTKEYFKAHRRSKAIALICAFIFILYLLLLLVESVGDVRNVTINTELDYRNKRLIKSSYGRIYKGKERLMEKKLNKLLDQQKFFQTTIKELSEKTSLLELNLKKSKETEKGKINNSLREADKPLEPQTQIKDDTLSVHQSNINYRSALVTENKILLKKSNLRSKTRKLKNKRHLISFPVSSKRIVKNDEIVLPSGSYVKAKLMTGIEAPEGKTYPVLLQLDFAHIIPNNKKVDLVGCFIIAKASGSLSTERVEMQAIKLSCVGKNGEMFERKINGFSADAADNSYGLIGEVNTKQDRVAAMAFLSSIVDGISSAIQMSQTSNSTNSLGGSSSTITGNQAKYMAAGGVGNAAGQVTQWYLKQAQSLLPTINVGSGRNVWLVLADKVSLPKSYFKQIGSKNNETVYSYITNKHY